MSGKMSSIQQTLLVAKWEFTHFFKWKQELISKLILLGLGLIIFIWQQVKNDSETFYQIIVPSHLTIAEQVGEFKFIPSDTPTDNLLVQLAENEAWHAVLELQSAQSESAPHSAPQVTVHSRDKQKWLNQLTPILQQQFTLRYAQSLGLAPEQLAAIQQSAQIENAYLDQSIKSENSPATFTAIGLIVLMCIGIFTSFGLIFVSITGEKQQRVTEQLYACMNAQTWIDGKILGQLFHAIKAMITTLVTGLISYGFFSVVIYNGSFDLSIVDWQMLPWFLLFACVGLYLCTAFMAAVAAAIDDPNHSAKTSIMLIPLVPLIITFITMDTPSGWALAVLSYLPITSFVAMPVKMSLVDVALWEPLLSLVLSLLACYWMRSAAGKLFKTGMTMYGKEPSVKEMCLAMFR